MDQLLVTMPVRMGFAGWIVRTVSVLVMLIMGVKMFVFHWFVPVQVFVALGQMQPVCSPSVLNDKIRPVPCRLPSWIWRVICKPKTEAVLVTTVTTVSQRSFEKHFPFAGNVWKVREEPAFFFAVRPHHCSLPLRRECGTLESETLPRGKPINHASISFESNVLKI